MIVAAARRARYRRHPAARVAAVLLLASLLAGGCSGHALRPAPPVPAPSEPATPLGLPPGRPLPAGVSPAVAAPQPPWATQGFRGAVVATSEPEPAEIAAGVLAAGGNAVDAAVAALFALNVVEPQSSGIGGGGFLLIHRPKASATASETVVVDCREVAPAAATAAMFGDAAFALASTSGIAVGVPGTVPGLAAALARYGTLSLAAALAPAITLAEEGFVVGPRLAESLATALAAGGRLASEPGHPAYDEARRVFAPSGVPPAEGTRLRQPDLARTLRLIAERGAAAVYDCGDPSGLARALIATQRAHRAGRPDLAGRMTCADLAAAAAAGPVLRPPVVGRYRAWTVKSAPPPSSGGVALLQMLAMLERFPLADGPAGFGFAGEKTLAVMTEAMRLAFSDRARWLGDPDRTPAPPVDRLLDRRYLASRAASCPDPDPDDGRYCIRPETLLPRVVPGEIGGEDGANTTHLTVIDGDGTIVSATASIEAPWGTGLMVRGFGFLLNNQLTDFNRVPTADATATPPDPGANDVAPGRRPRSSMAPTLILAPAADGRERPVAAFGSPGGAAIITTVLAITLNLIDHGMAVQTAIDAPRISLTRANGGDIQAEAGFPAAALARLEALGARLAAAAPIGSVQAVVIDPHTGLRYGGADRRRRGTVIGLP